tara:strand:+ start:5918 stop:6430 length:513 start_codon:yes stop_codon:yes gene_type:complete
MLIVAKTRPRNRDHASPDTLTGRVTVTVVPLPTSLWLPNVPPSFSAKLRAGGEPFQGERQVRGDQEMPLFHLRDLAFERGRLHPGTQAPRMRTGALATAMNSAIKMVRRPSFTRCFPSTDQIPPDLCHHDALNRLQSRAPNGNDTPQAARSGTGLGLHTLRAKLPKRLRL